MSWRRSSSFPRPRPPIQGSMPREAPRPKFRSGGEGWPMARPRRATPRENAAFSAMTRLGTPFAMPLRRGAPCTRSRTRPRRSVGGVRAPVSRDDGFVPSHRRALARLPRARRIARRTAALRDGGVRGVPRLRHPGARLSTSVLPTVRPQPARRVLLQEARVLSVVYGAPHDRHGRAPRRECAAPRAGSALDLLTAVGHSRAARV
jgi:hypothetical protein